VTLIYYIFGSIGMVFGVDDSKEDISDCKGLGNVVMATKF